MKQNILLFDGGMGTYFSQKNQMAGMSCEMAALQQPALISEIHKEYLEAGCRAIKTDTFAVNRVLYQGDEDLVRRVIRAAWELAAAAASGYDAYVFADIGPLSGLNEETGAFEEFRFLADQFLELGVRHFLFETNSDTDGLREIAAYIREKAPEAYIIVSFAVQADGYSRDGLWAADLFETMRGCPDVDALGLNCVCGARHMLELARELDHGGVALSLMPNAGYPTVVNNRTFYEGDPQYFAAQLREMAAEGAAILGGCCGTMPVHIEKAREALLLPTPGSGRAAGAQERATQDRAFPGMLPGTAIQDGTAPGTPQKCTPQAKASEKTAAGRQSGTEKSGVKKAAPVQSGAESADSPFWSKLQAGEKVFAVELDSPADANAVKFMRGAWELKGAGADIITIADCPIARARMDSSLLACKIRRELNMDALPHMTCRDRNLNATKALLFGLYAEGIRNVLLITGDPIPTAERDEVKSVYQFNSRKLAAFVTSLGKKSLPGPFHLFGALNVNARNFDVQIRLAKEKIEKGMVGFLTQPVLTEQAFENLKRARGELDARLLGGVIPVVSAKNARFMDSEINGINVDPKITELYEGRDRAEAEQLATEISVEIMRRISPYVDGYYLMTPFGRTGLIAGILEAFRE